MSVSRRMPKHSHTVVSGTCTSSARFVKLMMVALQDAAARRKRRNTAILRVAPSATISSCKYAPA